MPSALDVDLHPGRVRSVSDLVRDPVLISRPGVRWVVGDRYASSCGPTPTAASCPALTSARWLAISAQMIVSMASPTVLVGLGVLTNAADSGDHHEPQVQAQVTSPSSASASSAFRTVPGFSPWSSYGSGTMEERHRERAPQPDRCPEFVSGLLPHGSRVIGFGPEVRDVAALGEWRPRPSRPGSTSSPAPTPIRSGTAATGRSR